MSATCQNTNITPEQEKKEQMAGKIESTVAAVTEMVKPKTNPKKCSHHDSNGVQCADRPVKIIGDCRYCSLKYCSRHRLPEAHFCKNLTSCREEAVGKLTSKLMSEKTIANKI